MAEVVVESDKSIIGCFKSSNPEDFKSFNVPENINNAPSGSLLLIKNSLLLRCIMSKYTHSVFLYREPQSGVLYAISADYPKCIVVPIADYLKTLTTDIAQVDLFELQSPYKDSILYKLEQLHDFAMKNIKGIEYENDFMTLFKAKYKMNREEDFGHFFCSELVVYLSKMVGIPLMDLCCNYIPTDFSTMPNIWRKSRY